MKMRSSILRTRRRNSSILRSRDFSTRSSPNAGPERPPASQALPSVCRACHRQWTNRVLTEKSQRRWQSSPTASADEAVRSSHIPRTHYELFPKTLSKGPPPSGPFHIEVRELRREFLQLQGVAHPDRHPQELKTRAEATSARINEAYKTLQNPLLRAQYLLSLRGIDVAEDETAKVEDPDLLMEVLEAREEIEGAQEESELEGLRSDNGQRIDSSEAILDKAFRDDDMETAKGEAVRLRYWVNIQESLDAWEKGKPVVLVH